MADHNIKELHKLTIVELYDIVEQMAGTIKQQQELIELLLTSEGKESNE